MTDAAHTEALGRSEAFLDFQERLSAVAKAQRPVLLLGERGSGKELAAARLHYLSPRWTGPMVAVNCAAMAETLLPSELFGHEAGAFTGAGARKAGRFEAAHTGTLFIDEIGAMPTAAQEMVLRAVEYGEFERVGGSAPVRVDVRVVAATNADLATMARAGTFKPDLLDRLSFEVLVLPPLRQRHGDVELLAGHFAARMAAELGLGSSPRLTPQAMDRLLAHHWPGNVRELKNVVERAVFRAMSLDESRDGDAEVVDAAHVDLDPLGAYRPGGDAPETPQRTARKESVDGTCDGSRADDGPLPKLKAAVADLEADLVARAMDRARHNQRRAADLLGLTYHQFRGLYRKHKE